MPWSVTFYQASPRNLVRLVLLRTFSVSPIPACVLPDELEVASDDGLPSCTNVYVVLLPTDVLSYSNYLPLNPFAISGHLLPTLSIR